MKIEHTPEINVSQSTTETKKRFSKFRNRKLILMILAILIIGAFVAWYMFMREETQENQTDKVPSYSYDNDYGDRLLTTHLLDGDNDGSGMLFRLPLNSIVYTNSPTDSSNDSRLIPKELSDVTVDKGKNVEFGKRFVMSDLNTVYQSLIAAKIVPSSEAASFDKYSYSRDLIAKLVFNEANNPSGVGLGMSAAAKFTNGNIKSGASVYDISAAAPSGSDSPVSHVVGELVEVKGKNATYYLLVVAVDENWNSSPKTWQAIKNSIKVDQ